MNQLRRFLADTIDLQAEFLVARLELLCLRCWPKRRLPTELTCSNNLNALRKRPQGCYALIDYVNFKGEGVLHTERYQGQGWGLLQVLEAMQGNSDSGAPDEFARAAKAVLTPPRPERSSDRHESRWLTGWLRRVNSYSGG
jgi:hypothetical protein